MKRLMVGLLLCYFLCLPVGADELYDAQLETSGAADLFQELPAETREFLRAVGITGLEPEDYRALQPGEVLEAILAVFGEAMGSATGLLGLLLGVTVLCAFAEGVRHTGKGENGPVFSLIAAVAAAGAVGVPVAETVKSACEAAERVTVLTASFVPAYSALVLAGGQGASALSFSTLLLAAANGVAALLSGVVLPVLLLSLGLSVMGALSERHRLGAFGGTLAKGAGWGISAVTGLFVGLLSLQSTVAAATDSMGQRAARLTLSSFVPIVGGALGEAFGTVTGCMRLLRSTLGMFGVLAAVATVLPAFCRCFCWSLAIGVCRWAAELFEVPALLRLFGAVGTVMKALMAVLAAAALLLVISITLMTVAGGGL